MTGQQGKAGEIGTAKGTEHSMDSPNVGEVCHWLDASLLINHLSLSSMSPLMNRN